MIAAPAPEPAHEPDDEPELDGPIHIPGYLSTMLPPPPRPSDESE